MQVGDLSSFFTALGEVKLIWMWFSNIMEVRYLENEG